MKFWKVMYRLFHGKVLRFMSGIKSAGQVIKDVSSKGSYDPQTTSINFAVPNTNSICQFNTTETKIPGELPPGIIYQAIELKSSSDNSYVLSVDGNKIAPGLTEKNGDQDLFEHEDGVSLKMSRERITQELLAVETTVSQWSNLSTEAKIEKIEQIVRIVSFRIKDLRFLLVNQQLALKNFYKEAGDDWRTSRFVYAISSVQSMIYQIKAIVKRLLEINNTLLEEGTSINSSNGTFVNGKSVDCYSQNNWVTLKEPYDLPEQFSNNERFIKQRTEKWFNKRKEFLLTGSKLYEGIGLDSLKSLQKHYDKVVRNIHIEEQISEEVKQRMEHGTKSEIHATATLTTKILPFYCPDLKYISTFCS